MPSLTLLLDLLHRQLLPAPRIFEGISVDSLLDRRDQENFDRAWQKAYQELSPLAGKTDAENEIDQIRELSYKASYVQCHSSEMAAYISDDFELFALSLSSGNSIPWLNGLFQQYLRPDPLDFIIEPIQPSIAEQCEALLHGDSHEH